MVGTASRTVAHKNDAMPNAVKQYMTTREVYRNTSISILVDAFVHTRKYLISCQSGGGNSGSCTQPSEESFRGLFFLSHFHSDHYSGITKNWSYGTIYASRGTGNLVRWKLGVCESRVECLDVGFTYIFSLQSGDLVGKKEGRAECGDGCFSVELIPANHCPGAVMFLFRSGEFGTILHTGDFRFSPPPTTKSSIGNACWEPDLRNNAVLKSLGDVDVLFLDNTYCQQQFTFPPREAVLRRVNEEVLAKFIECGSRLEESGELKAKEGRTISVAVMVGSYGIGKEIVALSVQEYLPLKDAADGACAFAPIYVTPEKYESLQQLQYYPERFMPYHTTEAPDVDYGGDGEETKDGAQPIRQFTTHEVRLPLTSETSALDALSSTASHEAALNSANNGVKYHVALFLVPISLVKYKSLAPVVSRPLKRKREGGDGVHTEGTATSGQTIYLWGDEKVDLSRFDGVVAVNPTGWTAKTSIQNVGDRVSLLNIPYSEHCCFSELIDFVEFVNPARVVPTVSIAAFKQYESLFVERAPRLRAHYHGGQPISRFLTARSPVSNAQGGAKANDNGLEEAVKTEKQHNPFSVERKSTPGTRGKSVRAGSRGNRESPVCVEDEPENKGNECDSSVLKTARSAADVRSPLVASTTNVSDGKRQDGALCKMNTLSSYLGQQSGTPKLSGGCGKILTGGKAREVIDVSDNSE